MAGYRTKKIWIPAGGRKIKLLILYPRNTGHILHTGVLWIHGGGFQAGMPAMAHFTRARDLVRNYHAVVVSPGYRLSGEAPYPAALQDCHTALSWMVRHAKTLGICTDQIMVGGESAGGGLTAALCMYEKDHGGIRIAFQMPLYPMLDDRDTETSRDNHAPVWNTRRNHHAWAKYLRSLRAQEVPCYAVPARRRDYTNLPPAYTFISTAEPFYAETIEYIRNLKLAGVKAHMDIYPGLFHAFDMLLPFLKVSRQAADRFGKAFCYAQKHYLTPQKTYQGHLKS